MLVLLRVVNPAQKRVVHDVLRHIRLSLGRLALGRTRPHLERLALRVVDPLVSIICSAAVWLSDVITFHSSGGS